MKTRTLIIVATLAATITAGFGPVQEAGADGFSVRIGSRSAHRHVHRPVRRHARIHRGVHRVTHSPRVIVHHDVHTSPIIVRRDVRVIGPVAPAYNIRAEERLLGERDGYEAGRLTAFADARYSRVYSAAVRTDLGLHSRAYQRGYKNGFARGYDSAYHVGVSFYRGSLISLRLF